MVNHPNMGKNPNKPNERKKGSNPFPSEITAKRAEYGLSQKAAADLLFTTSRVWQQWELGERRMHPAFWELFTIKAEQQYGHYRTTPDSVLRLRNASVRDTP